MTAVCFHMQTIDLHKAMAISAKLCYFQFAGDISHDFPFINDCHFFFYFYFRCIFHHMTPIYLCFTHVKIITFIFYYIEDIVRLIVSGFFYTTLYITMEMGNMRHNFSLIYTATHVIVPFPSGETYFSVIGIKSDQNVTN